MNARNRDTGQVATANGGQVVHLPLPATSAAAGRAVAAADLRLRRHADFQHVYKNCRKQFSREMSFFFAPQQTDRHPAAAGPRIGLTVGKVMGGAVVRNRMKRRMREAVRLHAHLLGDLAIDVVLHPRKSVLTLDWTALEQDVAQVFRTVRRLAQKSRGAQATASPPAATA